MIRNIWSVTLILLISVMANAQVSISIPVRPVKCTYQETDSLGYDKYSCENGLSKKYQRNDLLKEPSPHKILYGCAVENYHSYKELEKLWKNPKECKAVKDSIEHGEKHGILIRSASKLGDQLGGFLKDCQRKFEQLGENYVANGGSTPTWSNIGMTPIYYSLTKYKVTGIFEERVYGNCEKCVTCVEPPNGYGVSVVLNNDIKESACKKGLTLTRNYKDGLWQPHSISPSEGDNICSEYASDAARVYAGTKEEKKSTLQQFDCNETNSVLLDTILDLKQNSCVKFETKKTSSMQIWCSQFGNYSDESSGKFRSDYEFRVKGCDGKVFSISHPCPNKGEEKDKWMSVPVGGTCPVFLQLKTGYSMKVQNWTMMGGVMKYAIIENGLKFAEWEKEPGPTVNILEDEIQWGLFKDDASVKKNIMKIMYQHIGVIQKYYANNYQQIDNYVRRNNKIEIIFRMDGETGRLNSVEWYAYDIPPLEPVLENTFKSLNESLPGYDGAKINIPLKIEPFGIQKDYSFVEPLVASSLAKANQVCSTMDAHKPRSASDISSILKELTPGLKSVYDDYQKKYHSEHNCEFAGKIEIGFKVDTSGKVTKATIVSSTTRYEEFDRAITSTIEETWNFCNANAETSMKIPFTFEPDGPFLKCQVDEAEKNESTYEETVPKTSSTADDEIAQRKALLKNQEQVDTENNQKQESASAAIESAKQDDVKTSMSTTKLLRIIVSSAVVFGGGVAALVFDKKAKDATTLPPTNEQEFKKGHDEGMRNQNARNVSLGIFATGLVALGISILF